MPRSIAAPPGGMPFVGSPLPPPRRRRRRRRRNWLSEPRCNGSFGAGVPKPAAPGLGPRSQRPRCRRRLFTPASLGLADATGAVPMRIGPRTYSITGPAPPPRRVRTSLIGAAVESIGVTNALLGGSIARRLRRRRLRLRRASAALAEEASKPRSSRSGRCFGSFGNFLRARTVISPEPSTPSSASSAAVRSMTS